MPKSGFSRLRKPLVLGASFVPLARLAWDALRGQLGANPVAEAMNRLGFWTLFFLLACLACTPLAVVLRRGWPKALRKGLGLVAFLYGLLHLCTYLGVDQFFDWSEIGKDIAKRKFITVGMAAFVLLVPLAVTSTVKMVKRLGFARWKALHRLAYVSAVLGVVHFYWRVKSDTRVPLRFAVMLGALFAVRIVAHFRRKSGQSRAAQQAARVAG